MKYLYLIFIFSFLQFLVYPQESHTYGPVKENHWSGYVDAHDVGSIQGQVFVITFVNWQWTYDNIPTEATLDSINIKFKAQRNFTQNNFHFTLHSVESNWDNFDNSYYTNQILNNDNRKVYEDNITSDNLGWSTFNKTITSGGLFNKFQDAKWGLLYNSWIQK